MLPQTRQGTKTNLDPPDDDDDDDDDDDADSSAGGSSDYVRMRMRMRRIIRIIRIMRIMRIMRMMIISMSTMMLHSSKDHNVSAQALQNDLLETVISLTLKTAKKTHVKVKLEIYNYFEGTMMPLQLRRRQ